MSTQGYSQMKSRFNRLVTFFLLAFVLSACNEQGFAQLLKEGAKKSAKTAEIACEVVGISDGDTLTCLTADKEALKVRLLYIDAPESRQAFGQRAKQALSEAVYRQAVTLQTQGKDKYQRHLAVVFNQQGDNINLALVEQGFAWAYASNTQAQYQTAQRNAQAEKRGLWRDPHPQNPQDFRRAQRNETTDSNRLVTSENRTAPLACQVKKQCRDFDNYADAKAYFDRCGSPTMDGDHDGIPCNKLYRKAQRQP